MLTGRALTSTGVTRAREVQDSLRELTRVWFNEKQLKAVKCRAVHLATDPVRREVD